jgi:hypothetical protein
MTFFESSSRSNLFMEQRLAAIGRLGASAGQRPNKIAQIG